MPRSSSRHSARATATTPATKTRPIAPENTGLTSHMPRRLCFCRNPLASRLPPSPWISQTRCLRPPPSHQSMGEMYTTSRDCSHQARRTTHIPYKTVKPLNSTAQRNHLSSHPVSISPRPNPSCPLIMHFHHMISCMRLLTCILSM